MLLHPVAPGVLLLLERGTIRRGVLDQALTLRLLGALQLPLLLLFLLALPGELLLPLLKSVISLWQEYSEWDTARSPDLVPGLRRKSLLRGELPLQ